MPFLATIGTRAALPHRWLLIFVVAISALSAGTSGTRAQDRHDEWTVQTSESAELWYHGLATVGFGGFSSLPLYDRDYADLVRTAKEAKGIYPTNLDRQAANFRRAFEADSTYEIFHFIPLYFGTAPLPAVLEALAAAVGNGEMPAEGSETAFGASVVSAVLRTREQRTVATNFLEALEQEWDVFLHEHLAQTTGERERLVIAASGKWNEEVAPAVGEFLNTQRTSGGLIVLSGPLGPEGRVFGGDPSDPTDNFVAVTLAHSNIGLGTSAYMLKELCFPVASDVVERLGLSRDRVNAERVSGRLAVRCGAELLQVRNELLANEYRETFLAVSAANGIPGATFEEAFPVSESALGMLKQALRENTR